MRIGIDISAVSHGRGPARYTTEIVKALSGCAKGEDIFILYSPSGVTIDGLASTTVTAELPLQPCRPWLNWTLAHAARRDRVDVMFFPANDCWLWKAVPAVIVLHDVAPMTVVHDFLRNWKDRLQVALQMRCMGRVAKAIVTVSHFSALEIARTVPGSQKKIEVVYNGVGEAFTARTPAGDFAGTEPYILFVGGFDRRKNLDRLLQAFKLLADKGRRERLVLVGKGGINRRLYYDMPDLIRHYGLEKKVQIKTEVGDGELNEYFTNASLLVLPSLIEGFGLPVIEAQACGCPVACSTAASLPEIGGDGACYFDPFDIFAIANSMEKVLINEKYRAILRENGWKNVRRFSWRIAGERIYSLLRDAADFGY